MSTSFRLCSRAPRIDSWVGSPTGTIGGALRFVCGSTAATAVVFLVAAFPVALVAFVAVAFAGFGLAAVFDTALARAGALPRVVDVLVPRRSAMVRSVYFRRTGVRSHSVVGVVGQPTARSSRFTSLISSR